MSHTLILGASSAIAQALINQLAQRGEPVTAISQKTITAPAACVTVRQCELTETGISEALRQLDAHQFNRVCIFNGILHNETMMPEKRLEDFDPTQFETILRANTLTPMLWLKHLKPLLKGNDECVVAVLSARIGSISDNQLGGWYAYRASKAALNMLVKTTAIEYARFAKKTRFLLFHPGTTDTPLSKPFQKSVPDDKLFTPDFVASRLWQRMADVGYEPGVDYLDFDGQKIEW